jgi:hypothetical protein
VLSSWTIKPITRGFALYLHADFVLFFPSVVMCYRLLTLGVSLRIFRQPFIVWMVADVLKSKHTAGILVEIRMEHLVLKYVFCRVIVVCSNFLVAISCWFIIILKHPTQPVANTHVAGCDRL